MVCKYTQALLTNMILSYICRSAFISAEMKFQISFPEIMRLLRNQRRGAAARHAADGMWYAVCERRQKVNLDGTSNIFSAIKLNLELTVLKYC